MNQGMSSTTSTFNTVEAPIIQQRTIVDAPIIQETIRNDRVVEIQPVVHRDVEQNVVHHIEKHIQEPHAPNMGGVIERNAFVEQSIHTNVVNEIQPIIHRERVIPVTERVEEHLAQRIVEPTIHTHEVIYENAPVSSLSSFSSTSSSSLSSGYTDYSTVNSAPTIVTNTAVPLNTYNTVNVVPGTIGYSSATATQSSKHGLFHRH